MTDFPISHSQPANSAEKIAAAGAGLIALFRAARGALAEAAARNTQRRVMRPAPEEILMAQALREEARRAVDRLLR
jgi:hypothetical protein